MWYYANIIYIKLYYILHNKCVYPNHAGKFKNLVSIWGFISSIDKLIIGGIFKPKCTYKIHFNNTRLIRRTKRC